MVFDNHFNHIHLLKMVFRFTITTLSDNNTKLNANYFYSMDNSKVIDCNHIISQPFVSIDDVEHVLFVDVELDSYWKYVLQSHARIYTIFDNIAAPILYDGRHIIDLFASKNPSNESVKDEDIEEDNDDAQETSGSLDGEADYADLIVIGIANTKLESKFGFEHINQRMRCMLYSCM